MSSDCPQINETMWMCDISRHWFINPEYHTFEGRRNYYTLILQPRENTTSNVNNNVIPFG